MKKIIKYFLFLLVVLLIAGCSASDEVKKEEMEDVYVFDEVPSDTLTVLSEDPVTYNETPKKDKPLVKMFSVQIGAFTTRERAEEFLNSSKKKLGGYECTISFSNSVQLYVVQLHPFETRTEAEKVRNELWKLKDFKDAFLVEVYK